MTHKALIPVWSVVLLFGGCPKRQTTPRIVYLPSPPAAATESQPASTQSLTIEQPPPPPPVETAPVETEAPAPAPVRRRARRLRPEPSTPVGTPSESGRIPALETSQSPAQEVALRNRVVSLQQNVEQRIERLNRGELSGTDLRTLGGARAFLAQSIRALQESDLQRALNLARKAYLLVQALEESQ